MNRVFFAVCLGITLFLLFASSIAFSQGIKGRVLDSKRRPLPYVTVIKQGSWIGISTNEEGLYSLELGRGEHIIEYRLIGFTTIRDTITIDRSGYIEKNIVMNEEHRELTEVDVVYGDDPANAVIREVIKRKEDFRKENNTFTTQSFNKLTMQFGEISYGDRIMGVKLDDEMKHELDTMFAELYGVDDGYFHSSESETMLYRDQNKAKEVMISSRVSGDPKSFAFNFSQVHALDFYRNNLNLSFTNKLFVSPLSSNGFSTYRYFMIDTIEDNNLSLYKIKVIPKNKYDNAFRGYIYIIDSLWRLHSLDLNLTKENKLQFIDSVSIKLIYNMVEKDIWKPINSIQVLYPSFNILGINAGAIINFNSIAQSYDFNPVFEEGFFDKELIKINKDANQKDSLYWMKNSPIEISKSEESFSQKVDSLYWTYNHPDSIAKRDEAKNKFGFENILLGYSKTNSLDSSSHRFSLLNSFGFNTVQGWNIDAIYTYKKNNENSSFEYFISPQYGFADKKLRIKNSFKWNYDIENLKSISFDLAFREATSISGYDDSRAMNTLYSIYFARNYYKPYEKSYAKLNFGREIFTGFNLDASMEYAYRNALVNNTTQTWFGNDSYTSNNPQLPDNDSPSFDASHALVLDIELKWNPAMKYMSLPHKVRVRSKYPEFTLSYRKAINPNTMSFKWADYDRIELGMDYSLRLKRLGNSNLMAKAGKFLNTENMIFADFKHFDANQYHIGLYNTTGFNVLPFYSIYSLDYYLEAQYRHNFRRYIFNKLPLLRKTKWSEEIGFGIAYTELSNPYMEFSFTINEIFGFFSLSYTYGYRNNDMKIHGVKLSLGSDAIRFISE